MPSRSDMVCLQCGSTKSSSWRKVDDLGSICLKCSNQAKKTTMKKAVNPKVSFKSKRNSRLKAAKKAKATVKVSEVVVPRGTGRRSLFKKTPVKYCVATATTGSSDSLPYKGICYQVGDVVSMLDDKDYAYYAQIRGFVTDPNCEKSAHITWLMPSKRSPPAEDAFDPITYTLGPDEKIPKKLSCMEFIMHAPANYFKEKTTPYPPVDTVAGASNNSTTLPIVIRD